MWKRWPWRWWKLAARASSSGWPSTRLRIDIGTACASPHREAHLAVAEIQCNAAKAGQKIRSQEDRWLGAQAEQCEGRRIGKGHHDIVKDEPADPHVVKHHGFGLQLVQREDGAIGEAYHIVDGSTVILDKGYHPCVAAPGYEMYYFTILGGLSQRPLVQFFQPEHAYQVETIPGIKDMIAKFK